MNENKMQQSIDSTRAFIWQGFHHAWEYNHRVNRLGSYIDFEANGDGKHRWVAGHTAASGTGNDTAHFSEFTTHIQAEGVAFQPGTAEAIVECERTERTPYHIRIRDLPLTETLQNREKYTVILNGFDLYAVNHSEKIITFDLEVDTPTVSPDGTTIRFNVLGNLQFDCRSPECQLLPMRLEIKDEKKQSIPVDAYTAQDIPERPKRGIDKRRVDKAFKWFKQVVVSITNMEDVKRAVIGTDDDTLRRRLFKVLGKTFFLKLLKWRIAAEYKIVVRYLIIAGDSNAFQHTESGLMRNNYNWDLETEISLEEKGTLPITVGNREAGPFPVETLAFQSLCMNITIDERHGTEDPIQWGKGMHFLEWSMAIREVAPTEGGVLAKLDLFYKCWSEAMNEVITLTTWGAFRGAGRADFEARLVLLQFREGTASHQLELPGKIYWPGRGLSAVNDPRARSVRPIELEPQ